MEFSLTTENVIGFFILAMFILACADECLTRLKMYRNKDPWIKRVFYLTKKQPSEELFLRALFSQKPIEKAMRV